MILQSVAVHTKDNVCATSQLFGSEFQVHQERVPKTFSFDLSSFASWECGPAPCAGRGGDVGLAARHAIRRSCDCSFSILHLGSYYEIYMMNSIVALNS